MLRGSASGAHHTSSQGKDIRRTFVDASVLQWGQIKTCKLYISICVPPSSVYNTDATFVIIHFYPQGQYKICVNIDPSNVLGSRSGYRRSSSSQQGGFHTAFTLIRAITVSVQYTHNVSSRRMLRAGVCTERTYVPFRHM